MPVIFKPFGANHDFLGGIQRFSSLLGHPFPNEEVEALWSMMSGNWFVEWYHNRSEFGVRRQPFAEIGDPYLTEVVIKAEDAHDMDIWRRAFAALVKK